MGILNGGRPGGAPRGSGIWPLFSSYRFIWWALVAALASAGDSEVEIRVKAAFIYNFTRFVEWPANTNSTSGSVRIGILGSGALELPLKQVVQGKSANGKRIEVIALNSLSDASRCDILWIEPSESKHLAEIVQSLAGKPVLTVCNGDSCIRDGGMIAFQIVDDSVRFQINQGAAERAGLKLSSQLLKVAIPAQGKHP
jgi:hypothetical protein